MRLRTKLRRKWKPVWREWKGEIVGLVLLVLGLFLLLEPFEIREAVYAFLIYVLGVLVRLIEGLIEGIASVITLSNSIALILLVAAVVVLVRRLRARLLADERYTNLECPECDSSDLVRMHRKLIHRLVSKLVPVRRYRCNNCGWTGLRLG